MNLKDSDEAKLAYYTALEASHMENHPETFQKLVAEAEIASMRRYLAILGEDEA